MLGLVTGTAIVCLECSAHCKWDCFCESWVLCESHVATSEEFCIQTAAPGVCFLFRHQTSAVNEDKWIPICRRCSGWVQTEITFITKCRVCWLITQCSSGFFFERKLCEPDSILVCMVISLSSLHYLIQLIAHITIHTKTSVKMLLRMYKMQFHYSCFIFLFNCMCICRRTCVSEISFSF